MKPIAELNLTIQESDLLMNLRLVSRQIANEALQLTQEQAEEHIESRITELVQEVALTSRVMADAVGALLRSQVTAHRAH